MPKYIMRDSTGQLWNDIDESNLAGFMSDYPGAEKVEEIADEVEKEVTQDAGLQLEEDSLEVQYTDNEVEVEEVVEDKEQEYKNKIKKDLYGYDPERAILSESFKNLPIDLRTKLSTKEYDLAKSGKWDQLNKDSQQQLMQSGVYDKLGRLQDVKDFKDFKNKKIENLSTANRDYGFEAVDSDEFSSYDGNMSQYNKDLSKALSTVKKGQIPTSVLDGNLGAKIVGHEEEQVYKTLNNLYGEYGFEFEEAGVGDNVKVYASNGAITEVSLDNWTKSSDKEEALKLKTFLDLNKGDYSEKTIKNMVIGADSLNAKALSEESRRENEPWYENWFKEDVGVTDELMREFDSKYDEDVVAKETKKLNSDFVELNTQYKNNQKAFEDYQVDLKKLQEEIIGGDLTPEEITARKAEMITIEQNVIATDVRLNDFYENKLKPMQANLQVIGAKQFIVEQEKGNFLGLTANTILGSADKIVTYFNTGNLATKEDSIREFWGSDKRTAQDIINREAGMAVSKIRENFGTDATSEYDQEFNSTVLGGVYTSIVEMGSMMVAASVTGPAAPVVYGALMGLSIAGGELEEMQGPEFEDLSIKERFGFATVVGIANGTLEFVGAKFGKIFGGGKNPVTNYVKKDVVGRVMSRIAGKVFTRQAVKKATNEIVDQGLKSGLYKLTSSGLRAGGAEAATEGSQEFVTRKLKQGLNSSKNKEIFNKAATEITISNLSRASLMGFLAGGPIGAVSAAYQAKKSGTLDKINDQNYRLAKRFSLNSNQQKIFSANLQAQVMDPTNPMTQEKADDKIRSISQMASQMRELDGMGLTIEGEKKAFTLLDKKRALQKQIDQATDKSIVKKQREDITQINKELENISLQYNFKTAFEAGLEQARNTTEASGKSFTEFNSSKEFEAKMKELGEQDDAGFKTTSGYIDVNGNIYINKEGAKALRDISVGQHELLHGVMGKQLGNVGGETVQQFKDSLSKSELDILQPRIDSSYGGDPTTEEYFNTFVDAVVKGDIKYNENIFTKIGDFITKNLLRPMGFSNAQLGFKDGRQVYNFVKDYAKQSRRIAQGQQEGFEGEVGDIVAEGTEGRASGAKSAQKISDSYKKIDEFSKNPDFDIDSEFDTKRLLKEAGGIIESTTSRLYDGTAQMNKEGVSREDFKRDLEALFTEIYKGYDEDMDVNMQGAGRQTSNLFNLRANKLATDTFKQTSNEVRADQSTLQIAAEEDTSKDTRTDREIRQDERKGVKVREKIPKVYDVDKVVKSIRSRAKSLKAKNIKQLKGTALEEISIMIGRDEELGKSIFKKLEKNSDLNKPEMLAIQNFINSNVDVAKGSLLEGYTSEFKATGVVNKLLEKFYNKRSVRAKTGPGLSIQVKKPNISDVEFKEAFGITGKDQANWNQKVVAKKGGVSDILKGFIRNFDQVISSQEIREQLIEDGEPIEATRTLRDGIPSGFFSTQTLGNLDVESQVAILDLLTSDKTLELAEDLRINGKSNWLGAALKDISTQEFREQHAVARVVLQKIGNELQIELDPKKSWQKYVKKAADVKINEAKIGIYSTLKQIAKARKLDIKTGFEVYENIDDINLLRSDIVTLIEELKVEQVVDENGVSKRAISDAEISKYILPALVGSYKMGKYKLKDNRKAPSIKLTEGEVFIDEGNIRQGIFGSATDAEANVNIDSKEKINKQIYAHDAWYNQKLSKKQQKKYGVEFFDNLPLGKRAKFVKNEIQPEGLRAKEILDIVVKKMASLRSENEITAQAASVFIDLQFARMDGLGKLASDVRFIPNNTKADLKKIFKLPKVKRGKNKDGSLKYIEDPFVLEHTIPGNRVKLAAFNAILGGDKQSMDLFDSELEQYHSAIIPFYFDSLVNRKDGKELYLRTAPAIREAGDFALSETGRYADDSIFPMSLYDVSDDTTYGQTQQLEETIEESRESNGFESKDSGVQTDIDPNGFFSKTNEDIINDFSKMDEALAIANSLDQSIKKIRVFDFDDTLAYTESDVLFTSLDGAKGKLNAEEFAKQGKELLDQGYKFDFSEFNKVTKGKPGPLLDIAKKIKAARGNEDLFVLTARAPEAQQAIYEFLKSQGVEFKKQNIIGLGNSTGEAKAQWLVGKAAEGYNDFYFADDAAANVRAVNENMSKLDVKSKTQLVKQNKIKPGKFSKTKLDFTTDEVGNMKSSFNIKNKNYVVSLDPVDDQGDYRYEFELKTKTGATQDITGTGDAVAVFRKVYNGLVDAIKQNTDIRRVEFSATKAEPSRISLYTSLMEKLGKDLSWETDVWETTNWNGTGSFDFEISKPRTKQPSSVERVLNVVDIKSKTQESRGRFSKQMSDDFNRIIEETRGLGREKTYSEARAKQVGSQKGKRKFWIPYSAEDMLGLIYPLLGKGKVGDAQMKWFKENLFNPFSKGMESLSAARVQLMADFKALKKNMDVPKDLQKEAFSGFTNEQAVRMYMWDMQGMEIPGISKRDLKDAKRVINSNEKLRNFAQMLIQINKGDGYPKPSESWLAGTITTDLVDGLNTIKRTKYLEQWQQNVDAIFSKENLNKLEAVHGSNYREALENMLTRMKTGKNRIEGSNRMSDKVLDWINGSVGAIMFFNTRSAVLQLISSINFVNLSDNNLYAAGKAFANQKQYWSDFKMLMNSDFLVDRRNGLKINVSESEIADAAKTSKNKARAVLNYILKKGFLPTQIADSFAIASGGATFYRNRVNTYLKDGMTQKEAESKAFTDFREISEESQQSSRPDKISQQQASSLGRVLLAFANTPMQYGRLTKRAYQDLINGRGDRKSNISKIIYYTAVQNMIFNVLQQAVTMLGFGDDEEDDEKKQKKYVDVANGMADSILRGLGIAGSAVSVAKNFLLDLYERSGRTRPEYVDSIYKLLQFSPPISSKISKLRQAAWQFDSKKRRQEIFDKGFSLDNPAYEAVGKVISATTNLPVDRVYNKINNIDAALAEDTETWESVAMLLGWPEWQIKPYVKKKKAKKSGYKSRYKRRNKPKRKRRK